MDIETMNHMGKNNYYCIIMAGGGGSRFWPVCRKSTPKQFVDFLGLGRTFLQMTYDRFAAIVPKENILIVTSERYYDLVKEQVPEVLDENILLEPYKRNTAPCVAYATYKLYKKDPDATVVVTPSDHLISGEDNFRQTINAALREASESDCLYTIGVTPTRPETNYGYIQVHKKSDDRVGVHASYKVKTFTEKPNADLAKVFFETGEFYWNSGMFIWNLKSVMSEMDKCIPEVTSVFRGGEDYYYTPEEKSFIKKVYEDCPSISVDYGVMEKTSKARVFLSTFAWSDVGTWGSVYEHAPNRTNDGNIVKCSESMIDDVHNSIIKTTNEGKMVVVRGFDDIMVLDLEDVLLVCHRNDQTVKDIVTDLTLKDKQAYL